MNCLLKHFIVGNTERRSHRRKAGRHEQLLDDLQEILETERGSTRLQSVENLLQKGLQTCHKSDYGTNGSAHHAAEV